MHSFDFFFCEFSLQYPVIYSYETLEKTTIQKWEYKCTHKYNKPVGLISWLSLTSMIV